MPSKNRTRSWCFTHNNPAVNQFQDDGSDMAALFDELGCEYMIYGKEVGQSGTPHYQGFIYFKQQKSFKYLKQHLPGFHIEPCKGRDYVNIAYCMKDGDYTELGTRPHQGYRSDLDVIRRDIMAGKSDLEIADENFAQWVQYRRSFQEYRRLYGRKSNKTLVETTTLNRDEIIRFQQEGYYFVTNFWSDDRFTDPQVYPKIVFYNPIIGTTTEDLFRFLQVVTRGYTHVVFPETEIINEFIKCYL